MPQATCRSTISRTARPSRASNAASSNPWPVSRASSIARRSGGRGRLPTCVVRMRSVLSFIAALLLASMQSGPSAHRPARMLRRLFASFETALTRRLLPQARQGIVGRRALGSFSMAEYRFCTVADEGRVRIVTINRPEVMNALHSEAHWEFDQVWNEFAADPELWVGIITGTGERAVFALPEPRVGLIAGSGVHRLPRMIPQIEALGMILTGRRVSAAEGKELGFVNEVVPEGQALAAAKRWAGLILECSPMAIRASKQSVYRSLDEPSLKAAMTTTYPAVKANLESQDYIEGPRAFAERRKPNWQNK